MKLSVLSCYLARYLSKNEITLILEFFFGVKGVGTTRVQSE